MSTSLPLAPVSPFPLLSSPLLSIPFFSSAELDRDPGTENPRWTTTRRGPGALLLPTESCGEPAKACSCTCSCCWALGPNKAPPMVTGCTACCTCTGSGVKSGDSPVFTSGTRELKIAAAPAASCGALVGRTIPIRDSGPAGPIPARALGAIVGDRSDASKTKAPVFLEAPEPPAADAPDAPTGAAPTTGWNPLLLASTRCSSHCRSISIGALRERDRAAANPKPSTWRNGIGTFFVGEGVCACAWRDRSLELDCSPRSANRRSSHSSAERCIAMSLLTPSVRLTASRAAPTLLARRHASRKNVTFVRFIIIFSLCILF